LQKLIKVLNGLISDAAACASNQGWPSRAHVYAPNHYAFYYDSYGNANMNPDRELGSNEE
jgi:hypothetical protein